MRYKKAPILEAVLEFRWSSPKPLDELKSALALPAYEGFVEPKPRVNISASINAAQESNTFGVSQQQTQIGYQTALRDGSEIVFLEQEGFVYIQRAPYDRWERFSKRALSLLDPTISALNVTGLSRVGLRFINRIDVPSHNGKGINTDDYITIKFDGPRPDRGIIEEFQMRVVKPTDKEGISYALFVATSPSPLPEHSAIILDIDVFTQHPVPSSGSGLDSILATMRNEKNDIFERCITEKARELFGGQVE